MQILHGEHEHKYFGFFLMRDLVSRTNVEFDHRLHAAWAKISWVQTHHFKQTRLPQIEIEVFRFRGVPHGNVWPCSFTIDKKYKYTNWMWCSEGCYAPFLDGSAHTTSNGKIPCKEWTVDSNLRWRYILFASGQIVFFQSPVLNLQFMWRTTFQFGQPKLYFWHPPTDWSQNFAAKPGRKRGRPAQRWGRPSYSIRCATLLETNTGWARFFLDEKWGTICKILPGAFWMTSSWLSFHVLFKDRSQFELTRTGERRKKNKTRMLTRMLMVQMSKHMDLHSRRTLFSATVYFEQSCTYFPVTSLQCGLESVECGV